MSKRSHTVIIIFSLFRFASYKKKFHPNGINCVSNNKEENDNDDGKKNKKKEEPAPFSIVITHKRFLTMMF